MDETLQTQVQFRVCPNLGRYTQGGPKSKPLPNY